MQSIAFRNTQATLYRAVK
ncbi:BgTH12-04718 [Blumeria graminis f. sp. triticale]|uniref:Bgt-51115 n=2 Tax=Blumeria graminis TaxID=34373 RepID=A0A9X9PQE6_BLUGR|nr:BgTH12-04718 [Blumeria graminis f. sp. triticale]VCU39205.1 Bgt-51115 [Blumeria graminis f. sp. tritici]